MAREDSKQAEKQYLSRTGGSAWEREKPFSPPGDDTLEDSLDLLHDFAVAAKLLQPAPTDRIIDLGAGGGWCSDLLQRLNRRPIAVDIARDVACEPRAHRTAPAETGDYGLKFDLVVEGVTWFEPAGTKVAVRPFTVTADGLTR